MRNRAFENFGLHPLVLHLVADIVIMLNALSSALAGLNRARENYNAAAERVSEGGAEVEALLDAKRAEMEVRVQTKNLSLTLQHEKELLDILA